MVETRGRVNQLVRRPIKAILSTVAPMLGRRQVALLLLATDRIGATNRVSVVLLDEAERRLAGGRSHIASVTELCGQLLAKQKFGDAQHARTLALLGMAEQKSGRNEVAITHLRKALSIRPSQTEWRVELLEAAAAAGDHTAFYNHLDRRARTRLKPAQLAKLLARLARACRSAERWQCAADAYHHASRLDPANKGYRDQFAHAERLAPDWGFYSGDPDRAWRLADYPLASVHGLAGPVSNYSISGWIPASSGDTRVTFALNGTVIADVQASIPVTLPDGQEYLQFSRILKGVWSFASAGDTLTVESARAQLAIVNSGSKFEFDGTKLSRADELIARLSDNHVINKYGAVRKSILVDAEWQANVIDLYERLRKDLEDGLGITLFPFYGTMLGAVREQNFISHDNDFDTAYISAHSEPDMVRQEFKDVCRFLISRGYRLSAKKSHTWVALPDTNYKLDIFYSWFNKDDHFETSYAHHGPQASKSGGFFEFKTEKLGDFNIPVPLAAEDILLQLYGHGWHEPDPGFTHQRSTRTVDPKSQLTISDMTDIYWSEFYRDHGSARASRFAEFVSSYFPTKGTIVEFGCGAGRDGLYFALHGWSALCCDRSFEAVARAAEAIDGKGLSVQFETVDASSATNIEAFLARHSESLDDAQPLVVYLRFFLHAIDETAQSTLLDTLTRTLTGDFYLCAEFRTIEDRNLAKEHGNHYRRYVDDTKFAMQLSSRWGFEVKHAESGRGLSPYGEEDPHLARIIAFRPASRHPQRNS